jgi:hypothetical protein
LEKHPARASSAQQDGYSGIALNQGRQIQPTQAGFFIDRVCGYCSSGNAKRLRSVTATAVVINQQKKLTWGQTVGNYSMMILAVTFLVL